MMRSPPRLPLRCRPHLTLRTPPLAGIRSPASGLRAMKSTNSNRSSSPQSAPAWRMNTAVSATVTGRVRICAMYAIGAYFQGGHRGGCSFMIHVRHAAAAIASGLCETVLITHGESGRSGVGRTCSVVAPTSLAGQFEQPYGPMGPPTLFTIPVLRYMKTYGLTHEQLAIVWVVQREWAAKNPRRLQGTVHLAHSSPSPAIGAGGAGSDAR